MPELPDITVYCEALEKRLLGQPLMAIRFMNPFVLRTVEPAPQAAVGHPVSGVRRLGKRIVIGFESDVYFVIHLMVAGRLKWLAPGAKGPGRIVTAICEFEAGNLVLTEAGSKKRASWHVVAGEEGLAELDPGGLEVQEATFDTFYQRLTSENRTLKRALTDPHLLSGIGNSYSDEILHAARLSPAKRTRDMAPAEAERLFACCRTLLTTWIERLRVETGEGFPTNVTAFRPDFAVHGRYGQPCPACGDPVQRIVYAANEANYCATCQTGGKLLADRAFSRLLKGDWPRTLEELEQRKKGHREMLAR